MAKVYVVVEEGYQESYGSYPYLIGVFHEKEKAESLIENSVNPEQPRYVIEVDEEDTEYPLQKGDYTLYANDYPLGGYAE